MEANMDVCSFSKLFDELKTTEQYLKNEYGLTFKESVMLCSIDSGFNEPAKLASQLNLSPSRTSRLISSLEKKELSVRISSIEDKRIIKIQLSKKGKKLIRQIQNNQLPFPSCLQQTLEGLDDNC